MKQLILMRHSHAQAERDPAHFQAGPGQMTDRDRPLTIEGMQDLEIMRSKLQGHLQGLDRVLCSNAKRTRQTLEGIKSALPSRCTVTFEESLYNASVKTLKAHIQAGEADQNFIMVIAHNPGLAMFLGAVITATQTVSAILPEFPPGSAAIFEGNFDSWSEAVPARFQLKTRLYP